ncbi:hypothetical protein F5I97DRAFT_231315 [Phlebopus sp. FC_14]|nr:hypothetical protein F5I97DRAFT_231315 [Phlebopus sp. FC_14]
MDTIECDYDVLGSYFPSFLDHLEETRARLGVCFKNGGAAHDNDTAHSRSSSSSSRLSHAAQLPSPSPWTEVEHAALFRALSLYSRWRPDLVAACVPTRSAWEVSVYLEALEEGAAQLAALEDGSASGGIRRGQRAGGAKNKGKGKAVELDVVGPEDMDGSSSPSSSSSSSDSDSGSDQDSSSNTLPQPYAGHEQAHEVSSYWIDAEESMAAWIVHEDWFVRSTGVIGEGFGAASDAEEDIKDIKPSKRRRGRPRGSKKRQGRGRARVGQKRAASRSPSHSHPVSQSHVAATPDFPSQDLKHDSARNGDACPARKRRKCQLAPEEMLARLEEAHLVVLDGILREAEEANWMRNTDGSQAALRAQSLVVPERERAVAGQLQVTASHLENANRNLDETTTEARILEARGEVVPDSMIDPVLLAMSRAPSENVSSHPTPTSEPPPIPMPEAPLVPVPQPFPTAVNASWPAPLDAIPDTSHMSPRSRRRLHKRFYMRRRRALFRAGSLGSSGPGESVEIAPDQGVDMDGVETEDKANTWKQSMSMERLKPGKKAKLGRSTTPACSVLPSAPASEPPSDAEPESESESRGVGRYRDEGDTENPRTRSNKPGLTLPYKLKATFAELGIDAAYLRAEGMDLLHLSALGKLMGLYTSLEHGDDGDHGEEETLSLPAQSVDAQLIRHLQAAVVWFVTDVVHRTIVWREREVMLKERSRAWRGSDQVLASAPLNTLSQQWVYGITVIKSTLLHFSHCTTPKIEKSNQRRRVRLVEPS